MIEKEFSSPKSFRLILFKPGSSPLFFLVLCFQLLFIPKESHAQRSVTQDVFNDYHRTLQIEGVSEKYSVFNSHYPQFYRSGPDTLTTHPWQNLYHPEEDLYRKGDFRFHLYDPEFVTFWRNLRPGGINNGAIWEGRGFTSSFSTGFHMQYGVLSASFHPLIIYHQNRNFGLSRYPVRDGLSEFSHPFYRIDSPQRFGDDPFWTLDPGPSYIRAGYQGFEAGLSNQNRRWGPALYYPIILSDNAPGFWHFFAGTSRPKDIYIGDLEATLIWGKLLESDYFDRQSFNDERYITGFTLALTPKPVPGLKLGFSRVFYRMIPPEGIPVSDLFRVFEAFTKHSFLSDENLSGNDDFSQMLSLYARWVFPGSGFEIYGEWSRNDHSWNLRDALGEPEHSRAYMAGFQKSFTLSNSNIFVINAELVEMEASNTRNLRSDATYYAHHIVTQGYTHKGQILGLGFDPGSNSQILNGKYFFDQGKVSGWFRRTVYNNDFLYRSDAMLSQQGNEGMQKYWLHNFELAFGSSLVFFYNQWETEIGFELAREFNDDFIYENDQTHLAMNLRVRYRLSSLR